MKICCLDCLCAWLQDYSKFIDYVKVTNIKPIGFNTLEGSRYVVNVKVIAKKSFQNKLLSFTINSTYLDDSLTEISNECLSEYLNNCLL